MGECFRWKSKDAMVGGRYDWGDRKGCCAAAVVFLMICFMETGHKMWVVERKEYETRVSSQNRD